MRLRIQTCPSASGRLPALKVWFAIPAPSASPISCLSTAGTSNATSSPPIQTDVRTIKDLKRRLCESLPGFERLKQNHRSIVLSMDGFELLEDGEISGVLRDGDLVTVGYRPGDDDEEMQDVGKVRGVKRKRGSAGQSKKVTAKQSKAVSPSDESSDSDSSTSTPSSDSSSSSSTSTSSSETTSGSESDTDSDSDSDSGTSSSAPSVQPIRKATTATSKSKTVPKLPATVKGAQAQKTLTHPAIPVPPGYGKATTHSRNERRKKKRQALKDAASGVQQKPPPKGSSDANSVPLGARASSTTRDDQGPASPMLVDESGGGPPSLAPVASTSSIREEGSQGREDGAQEVLPGFVMASLRNKNKKKGFFKQAMLDRMQGGPEQRKIKFGEEDKGQDEGEDEPVPTVEEKEIHPKASTSSLVSSGSSQLQRRRPRLVPPSELQDAGKLPSNIFVTSIDVEEGMPSHSRKNKKRRKKNHNWDEFGDEEYEEGQFMDADATMDSEEQVIQLVYDDEPEKTSTDDFDWERVEQEWDTLEVVHEISQLEKVGSGGYLAWKELSLNPATFSPEMMLNVGKVSSTSAEGEVTFSRLTKPSGENDMAAAFGLVPGDGEESVDETIKWDEVKGTWRIVRLS